MNMARVPYFRWLKVPILLRILVVVAAASSILVSCIERTNPFDPINSRPQAAEDVRTREKPALDAITNAEPAFTDFLKGVFDQFSKDSAANKDRVKENSIRRGSNLATEAGNSIVDSSNRTQPIKDSLRLKTELVELDTLKAYGPYAGFFENRDGLQFLAATLKTHFAIVNAGNFPLVIYPPDTIRSKLEPFVRDSLDFAWAELRFDSANIAVKDSNSVVDAYKIGLMAKNLRVKNYNDSIIFLKRIQNVVVIGRSDSLKAGAAVAKAGDSLFLGPGTFNVDLRFDNTGTAESPIVVSGFPGGSTIIRPSLSGTGSDYSLVLGSVNRHIHFENLVFRGGDVSNVKLEGGAREISFQNCHFDSSAGSGFEAFDSQFKMENCEIRANGGIGVKLGGGISQTGETKFINVLIVRNGMAGLHSTSQLLDISKCTIAENGEAGVQIISPLQMVNITTTLIAGNKGYGIQREATNINQGELKVELSDLFGNEGGNWFLPNMDSSVTAKIFSLNSNEDPEFTDAPAFDYSPAPGSFLDIREKQDPPLVIGYRRLTP